MNFDKNDIIRIDTLLWLGCGEEAKYVFVAW